MFQTLHLLVPRTWTRQPSYTLWVIAGDAFTTQFASHQLILSLTHSGCNFAKLNSCENFASHTMHFWSFELDWIGIWSTLYGETISEMTNGSAFQQVSRLGLGLPTGILPRRINEDNWPGRILSGWFDLHWSWYIPAPTSYTRWRKTMTLCQAGFDLSFQFLLIRTSSRLGWVE